VNDSPVILLNLFRFTRSIAAKHAQEPRVIFTWAATATFSCVGGSVTDQQKVKNLVFGAMTPGRATRIVALVV